MRTQLRFWNTYLSGSETDPANRTWGSQQTEPKVVKIESYWGSEINMDHIQTCMRLWNATWGSETDRPEVLKIEP